MTEISLHILDIAQNSIKADAKNIEITIYENTDENILSVTIKDDGNGMNEEFIKTCFNPFVTTKRNRKIGLGLSLLKTACESCGGSLNIKSKCNEGTVVTALFLHNSINRQPIGDIASSIATLLLFNTDVGIKYNHTYNENSFEFDSDMYLDEATTVAKSEGDLFLWLENLLKEKIDNIYLK